MTFANMLRRLSDRGNSEPSTPVSPSSPHSPRDENTWRSVFNPGRNYNMKGPYYDNVPKTGEHNKSIWEQHLASRKADPSAVEEMTPHEIKKLSPDELRTIFSSENVEKALKANADGADFNTFVRQLKGA